MQEVQARRPRVGTRCPSSGSAEFDALCGQEDVTLVNLALGMRKERVMAHAPAQSQGTEHQE
jgi:hypothetical protein